MARGAIRRGNLTLYPNWQLNADLRRTGVFDDELRRRAELGALGAKELAVKEFYGVDSRTGAIGAYYGSIHPELGSNRRGLRVGLVVASDWKAHFAERGWTSPGGKPIKARKILARGARRSGLKVRAPRKR